VLAVVAAQAATDVAHSDALRARYAVTLNLPGPRAHTDTVIQRLEHTLHFQIEDSYNTQPLSGFAAMLTRRQAARLRREPFVSDVVALPTTWTVLFQPGTDAAYSAGALARKYHLALTRRYDWLGGFAARLTLRQLDRLSLEHDVLLIAPARDLQFVDGGS
jgi:nucleoid DNA-binding protein